MGTTSQVWAVKLSKSASWEGEGVAVVLTGSVPGEAGEHKGMDLLRCGSSGLRTWDLCKQG